MYGDKHSTSLQSALDVYSARLPNHWAKKSCSIYNSRKHSLKKKKGGGSRNDKSDFREIKVSDVGGSVEAMDMMVQRNEDYSPYESSMDQTNTADSVFITLQPRFTSANNNDSQLSYNTNNTSSSSPKNQFNILT